MKKGTLLLAALAFTGCSLKTMALHSTADLLDDGAKAFYNESDTALARETMGSQLKLLEALLQNEPDNAKLLALASQGWGGYAFLFFEDTEPARAKNFYLRGRDYGLRLLARRLAFKDILGMGLPELEEALKGADKADAGPLFWAAYGWAGWVNLSRDEPAAVADLPKAVLLMKRSHELVPDYYFGGTDLFFGSYFASRPKMLGGDPEKAKVHFDWAEKINQGKFLMAYVLQAKYYAVATQDQELFKTLLTKVKELPAGALPDARLADEVAKEKAAKLMEKINDYF